MLKKNKAGESRGGGNGEHLGQAFTCAYTKLWMEGRCDFHSLLEAGERIWLRSVSSRGPHPRFL